VSLSLMHHCLEGLSSTDACAISQDVLQSVMLLANRETHKSDDKEIVLVTFKKISCESV
jgi:hypothetical protein